MLSIITWNSLAAGNDQLGYLAFVGVEQRVFDKGILVVRMLILLAELNAAFHTVQTIKILLELATVVKAELSLQRLGLVLHQVQYAGFD